MYSCFVDKIDKLGKPFIASGYTYWEVEYGAVQKLPSRPSFSRTRDGGTVGSYFQVRKWSKFRSTEHWTHYSIFTKARFYPFVSPWLGKQEKSVTQKRIIIHYFTFNFDINLTAAFRPHCIIGWQMNVTWLSWVCAHVLKPSDRTAISFPTS